MIESITDECCIESITQGCCEGGRRPFSERKLGPWNHKGEPLYTESGTGVLDELQSLRQKVVDARDEAIATSALLDERAKDYGPPEINMTGIGLIWTAQLRNHYGMADLPVLSGQMVALMMAGLKLNRLAKSPDHQDSYDDARGYLQIAESVK